MVQVAEGSNRGIPYFQTLPQHEMDRALILAVATGQTQRVRQLLDAGANPEFFTYPNLATANVWDSLKSVDFVSLGLLPPGIGLADAVSSTSFSVLHVAAMEDQNDCLEFLLNSGVDVHKRTCGTMQMSTLEIAVIVGNDETIQLLAKHNAARMIDLAKLNALRELSPPSIQALVASGARIYAPPEIVLTSLPQLMQAALEDPDTYSASRAHLLLVHGHSVRTVSTGYTPITSRAYRYTIVPGSSALMIAADQNRINLAKILLKHCCDVNLRDSQGDTALIRLYRNCSRKNEGSTHEYEDRTELFDLLIAHGADIQLANNQGMTAARMITCCHWKHLRRLRAAGADLKLPDYWDETLLMRYIYYLSVGGRMRRGAQLPDDVREELAMFMQWPDVLLATCRNGMTPLMLAAMFGFDRIVELLLDSGVCIDTRANCSDVKLGYLGCNKFDSQWRRDLKGWTALMVAAFEGYKPTVKTLLLRGASTELVGGCPQRIRDTIAKVQGHLLTIRAFPRPSPSRFSPWTGSDGASRCSRLSTPFTVVSSMMSCDSRGQSPYNMVTNADWDPECCAEPSKDSKMDIIDEEMEGLKLEPQEVDMAMVDVKQEPDQKFWIS